jgi:Na/Pi-cotransporter
MGTPQTLRKMGAALVLVFAVFLAGGCQPTRETAVAKLRVRRGGEQLGLPGAACEIPLQVEVLGPERRGALGGKARRAPVAGARVVAEPMSKASGIAIETPEATSDEGGHARFAITLGKTVGDQYIKVRCPEYPDVPPLVVRFTAGVTVKGAMQELAAGDDLPEPIRVRVTDAGGRPSAGVPVYFRLAENNSKAKLSAGEVLTDESGTASVHFQSDSHRTGRYDVIAEVSAPERGIAVRGITIPVLAMNRMSLLIGVLGGLGIFIFGMKLMSDGLQQTAGDRLKAILQFFTRNRVTAVFAGLVVTALIQSSSACTVMVVGFVNAGLLNLTQAIGIVFGAAIGTTVTAQMVSFKLDGIALPAIVIGVVMLLCSKRSYTIGVANTILGFGLLFFGMKMMSADLKVISHFPSFTRFFHMFDCTPNAQGFMPIGAVLGAVTVGTVMTMIVQSSSATIGLAIALAGSGLINFYTAVPLILGDNIGTTITAILASIGTNRHARQAAVANTIFKVLGVSLMILCFYIPLNGKPAFLLLVNHITAGNVFAEDPENIGRHVAAAHTLFNVLNVILFLPLVPLIAKICRIIVPSEEEGAERVLQLEPHLLQTPSVALQQSVSALVDMTQKAFHLTDRAVHAFLEQDLDEIPDLRDQEARIDQSQHEIIQYLVELNRQRLTEEQAAAIPVIMHCVNDVERIGDRATNILDLATDAAQVDGSFSEEAFNEVRDISERIRAQAELLVNMLETGSGSSLTKALKIEGEINSLTRRYEQHHERRLQDSECTVRKGIIFVELLANLERIGDHLSNIAERSSQIYEHHVELGTPPQQAGAPAPAPAS